MKSSKHHRSIAFLAALTTTFLIAHANASMTRGERRLEKDILACVDEIGRQVDYGNASRVMHRVINYKQKSTIELSVKIESAIISRSDNLVVRRFEITCVTNSSHNIVDFRIHGVDRHEAE